MLLSFLLSVTLSPLLASMVLREGDMQRELRHRMHASRLSAWQERTMRALLRRRALIIPFAIVAIGVAALVYNRIGSDFMPEMDEGTFVLDYWSPPGTSPAETDRMLKNVERMLMSTPEVDTYSRRTGLELGFFMTEPNTGDFLVKLHKKRSRDIDEVIAEVRENIESSEPALRVEFGQLMMDVIGDLTNNPQPVEIKLVDDDQAVARAKAAEVAVAIASVPGVTDIFNGTVIAGPSVVIRVDPAKAALAGFDPAAVADQLESMMRGNVDTRIQRGEKLIGIRVRLPDSYRTDMEKISQLTLTSPSGKLIPLASFATVEKTAGQAEVRREGLRPVVAVTARIAGRDLGSTIGEIQQKLAREVYTPPGMTVEYGGVYQSQQESFRGLLIVAIVAILLVFVVLLTEFGEFAVPVSIVIVNLMSLLGVFSALWIAGISFNISSFVGIIMIIGIVAENAIVIMHEVKRLRAEGVGVDDALVSASMMRARPIIMTMLAAVCALLPLALGVGAGAQLQRPLAIAVIGGFSLSSVLTLFGLPLLYRMMCSETISQGKES
jgi:multidrug efflux pump subunit AcrB